MHTGGPAAVPTPGPTTARAATPTARRIALWRAVAVGALIALVALGLGWELWWAPLPGGQGRLALKVLPLCLPLPGLLKHRLYTYRWTSLLVWLYVLEGLVRATSDHGPSAALAAVEAALSALLFAACAVYVRLRLRHGRETAGTPIEHGKTGLA
jgi:uncharacterized membrane protein